MAKDLKYYSDLSKQLGQEIEILESSYQDFEKVIDVNNFKIRDLTEEQRIILREFGTFSKEEGFSKDGRIRVETYNDVKSSIVERVEFLKKQKEINDKMLSLQNNLNELKKENKLSDADVEGLKKSVAKRYDEGTEKYVEELEKAKKKLVAKRIEETKESITKANEELKKNKKENGLGKVVSSVFGPFGNKIYNAYAKVFNWDLKNYKKNKFGNIALKAGLGVGSLFLLNAIAPAIGTTLAAVIALGALGVTAYSIYKVAKKDAQFLPLKNDKKISLREAWKRFRKSRGKGELSVEKKLYNGIDFSKYEKKNSGADGTTELKAEDKNDKSSEFDKNNGKPELPEVEKKGENPELPEEDKKNENTELPEVEKKNENTELPEVEKKNESEKKYNNPEINPTFRKTLNLKKDLDERCGDRFSNVEDAKKAINNFLSIVDDYKNGKMFNNLENDDVARITHCLFSFVNAYVYFNIKNKSDEIININGNELKVGEVCKKIMQSGIPKDMLGIVNDYLSMHKRIENKINQDNEKNQKGK